MRLGEVSDDSSESESVDRGAFSKHFGIGCAPCSRTLSRLIGRASRLFRPDVSLFRDDDFRFTALIAFRVVVFIAIDEHHKSTSCSMLLWTIMSLATKLWWSSNSQVIDFNNICRFNAYDWIPINITQSSYSCTGFSNHDSDSTALIH